MARFAKTILTAGKHESPEGTVDATPARIKRWAEQHNAMRAAGMKTPVPWGHHLKAVPQYEGERAYLDAKLNAGYFPELRASEDGNSLEAVVDVPGVEEENGNLITWGELPSGVKVKCAIGEVSAAVTKKFTDGRGRVWDDVITHLALVPLPVVADQDGFRQLATGQTETVFLSLGATGWRTLGTAAMDDPKIEKGGKPAGDEKPDEVVVEDNDDVLDEEPGGDEDAGDEKVQEVIRLLAQVQNVHIQNATTKKELVDQLHTILSHLEGAAGELGNPMEPEAAAPVVAEQSPAMMSLTREEATPSAIEAFIRDNPANPAAAEMKRIIERDKLVAKELKPVIEQAQTLATQNHGMRIKRLEDRRKLFASRMEKARKAGVPQSILDLVSPEPNTLSMSLVRGSDELAEVKTHTPTEVLRIVRAMTKEMPSANLLKNLSTAQVEPNPLRAAQQMVGGPSEKEAIQGAEFLTGKKFATPSANGNGKHKHAAKSDD